MKVGACPKIRGGARFCRCQEYQVPVKKSPSVDPVRFAQPTAESRYRLIAELAYLKAQERGFEPGHEVEDWLAAEVEIDTRLGKG
jgi:hypothetical protein